MSPNVCWFFFFLRRQRKIDVDPLNECWKTKSEQSTNSLLHVRCSIWTHAAPALCSPLVWSRWSWLLEVVWIKEHSKHFAQRRGIFFSELCSELLFHHSWYEEGGQDKWFGSPCAFQESLSRPYNFNKAELDTARRSWNSLYVKRRQKSPPPQEIAVIWTSCSRFLWLCFAHESWNLWGFHPFLVVFTWILGLLVKSVSFDVCKY